MNPVSLICLDLDGTLIGVLNEVHPRVWEAAARARTAGLHLAICTGRPALGQTRAYAEQLDPTGWHIFQGGASLVNLGDGHGMSEALPAHALGGLRQLRQERGWVLELYSNQDYVCDQAADGSEAAWLAIAHAHLLKLDYAARPLDSLQGEVVRAQWVVSDQQLPEVMATALEGVHYASATSPSVPGVHFVSVTAPGVDKCSAIRRLAQDVIGCGLEQTMMVGDGLNDLSAMELVGYPVAMANGEPELQQVCRYRAGHVNDGGAADAIDLALKINQEV
ncbi:MAG: HAD hydrolase family protein [Candidatus Sericytochromatia bacterium]